MTIQNALISVYYKEGIAELAQFLNANGVRIFSTGGTFEYLESLGILPIKIETLTGFPEILDGRVKTLHPAVFSGILAKRNGDHQLQLQQLEFPNFDLVVVNLYPFEETVASNASHAEIIEKIDIGGVALIRAAAKNYAFVNILSSVYQYAPFIQSFANNKLESNENQRLQLAIAAFELTAKYDQAIFNYLNRNNENATDYIALKYGENPHQQARLEGNWSQYFKQFAGKTISYNNLLDIEAALRLYQDFPTNKTCCAIFKHNTPCGIAFSDNILDAWQKALACDPVSAFGGVIILNHHLDLSLAKEINQIFYEIILAPSFDPAALEILKSKKNRIILEIQNFNYSQESRRSFLGLELVQTNDELDPFLEKLTLVSGKNDYTSSDDLHFAILCAKHLKSNAIAIVKNQQMIGAGSGQTSRIDALKQAITKMVAMGFNSEKSTIGSDAFFPFSDGVEIALNAGIMNIVQPGGSVRDQEVIDFCNKNHINMWFTGIRHFKH